MKVWNLFSGLVSPTQACLPNTLALAQAIKAMASYSDQADVSTICSLTGVTPDQAQFFLEANNGDVQQAVSMCLGTMPNTPLAVVYICVWFAGCTQRSFSYVPGIISMSARTSKLPFATEVEQAV